ncbi:MAG TPA: hypothetical protein VNU68_21480 [Verrucomicrobiae bacterium]|nr:hypothetical protein [Verrucomicrobiae bacterium]
MKPKFMTVALAAAFTLTTARAAEPAVPSLTATPSADDAAELAKKLSNPVAALISVPFQNNFDFGGGPKGDGFRYTMNFQPVAPFTLTAKWNLITRPIVPVIHQHDMIGTSSQTGLGDITQRSVAGNGGRPDVSSTFLQPFVAYQTKTHTTLTLNTESAYDLENSQWTVPVNVMVSQLVKIGKLPVSFTLGARYYAEAPKDGPEWGLRFAVTLLFPK